MSAILNFTGFIKNLSYRTYLNDNLKENNINNFDINRASGYGIINSPTTELAYSKWVFPKRTRSYPFARISYIIQESKNTSTSSLPKLSDIQDGLFKLIIFSNLDSLTLNEKPVSFVPKLKLTGKNVTSSIVFPEASSEEIENFITVNTNTFSSNQKNIIRKLALEAQNNNKLKIEISGNS